MTEIPLSLYVHFPWCIRKCPYCDFNSHELRDIPEDRYIDALLADLDSEDSTRPLQTIFMGGGTPSLFSPHAIDRLLEGIFRRFQVADSIEITLEANPGTVDSDRFRGYQDAGVNRLSLGIQSFNDQHLTSLGRIHDGNESEKAVERALEAGFNNLNLDLMHGLPGQNVDEAIQDLERAIGLGPAHISWYQLTIERNTVFHKSPPILPSEDNCWEIYEEGIDLLASRGYPRYEVSGFAASTNRCRHNLNYWTFGDYLGIGAGAHGKLTDNGRITSDIHLIRRTTRTRSPNDYLRHSNSQSLPIDPESMPLEFLMNALRLVDGVPTALFRERTGLPLNQLAGFLKAGRNKGLLVHDEERLQPTAAGLRFLDHLLLEV